MGPLVPYIISSEFGLVIALLIGIAFGFVLEQAGFSSTKKLVGLFYGNDFTVLRVFFTAGITAMVGVLLLGHYGLLDLSIIYINPTFLRSAIVGGAIMGAGFIIGGFCPGTSVCAAAIGKLDAFAFIGGSLLGILAFTEFFPLFEDFYVADNMGPVLINEWLGMSKIGFGFIMVAIAIAAFYFTWLIENRVNKTKPEISPDRRKRYALAMVVPFVILMVVAFLPGKNEIIHHQIAKEKEQKKCVFREIAADKLAYEITHQYYQYNIIDVRPPEEYEKWHLPLAINIPFDDMMNRQWEKVFKQRIRKNVFYADNDTLVKMACLKAKYIGDSENFILKESAEQFRNMFYEASAPAPTASKQAHAIFEYRRSTAEKMDDLVKTLQNIGQPVKKEIQPIQGGCS
ncbi:MAG: YeeE/YedE thiosulfate transporter family protein [Mariniphaga sp.]